MRNHFIEGAQKKEITTKSNKPSRFGGIYIQKQKIHTKQLIRNISVCIRIWQNDLRWHKQVNYPDLAVFQNHTKPRQSATSTHFCF